MEQTPVEWLQEQLKKVEYNALEKNGYSKAEERLFERAKEMEEEQSLKMPPYDLDELAVTKSIYSELDYVNGFKKALELMGL